VGIFFLSLDLSGPRVWAEGKLKGALMAFRVNNGVVSISAQRHLDVAQRQIEHSLTALASGSRITQAGDDAAGFAIANALKSQLAGSQQAKMNAEMATGLIQTAEGGLNEQNNILIRMRELAVQAASDTVGDNERGYINNEFTQLSSEYDRIAKSTRYGNKQLLTGNGEEFSFQVGPNAGVENIIKFKLDADTTGSASGVSGLDVSDRDSAAGTITDLEDAMQKIAKARATFGSAQSRFQYAIDNLAVQGENLSGAVARIVDVDVAEETSKLAQGQIQQQAGVSVLAQANASAGRVLRLIE
jgi:flagellin